MNNEFQIPVFLEYPATALGRAVIRNGAHTWSYENDVLAFIPEESRSGWVCNTCRKFFYDTIEAVLYSDNGAGGVYASLVWRPEAVPIELVKAAVHISEIINDCTYFVGAFMVDSIKFPYWDTHQILGTPEKGGWGHLHVVLDPTKVRVVSRVPQTEYAKAQRGVEAAILPFTKNYNVFEERLQKLKELLLTLSNNSAKIQCIVETYTEIAKFAALTMRLGAREAFLLTEGNLRHQLQHLPDSVSYNYLVRISQYSDLDLTPIAEILISSIDPLTHIKLQKEKIQRHAGELCQLLAKPEKAGALDWLIATELETPLLTKFEPKVTKTLEPTDTVSVLERMCNDLTPKALLEPTESVSMATEITWDDFLTNVLPRIKNFEFEIPIYTKASILMCRKDFKTESPLRTGSDYSVITTGNPQSAGRLGLVVGWNNVSGTIDPKLIQSDAPAVFVLQVPAAAESYGLIPPPLFVGAYKPEYSEYKDVFNELMCQSFAEKGKGKYAHILLPARGSCRVRVTTHDDITTKYLVVDA